MWKPRGLSLGEIGIGWVVHVCLRCSPLKGGRSYVGPLILVNTISRLRVGFGRLDNEATL